MTMNDELQRMWKAYYKVLSQLQTW